MRISIQIEGFTPADVAALRNVIRGLAVPPESRGASAPDRAETWLRRVLANGPCKSIDLRKRAKAEKIAWAALLRAKTSMGMKASRRRGSWWWELS